ncbi:uncharacterized protein LOC141879213 isoform X2 [Acropora palmata]|uniref:uncharacterized protein LOC141879213 isoform X2 n=1 Tax=Acropora palmata TaxID=6131 RepID=UPI003DA0BF14
MKQLASLLFVWSLCCFQENLVESTNAKCASNKLTVQWSNGTIKECLHCEKCQPGRGLYPHKCGDTVIFPVKIECKKCDSGKTFSDKYDSGSCKLCHLCAEFESVTKICTPSSDTECNKTCNHGYFFSKPQQVCKMCSYCCLDGKDEKQPQCINQGLTAVNQYCSPRPDRTCNPSTPTGSVISPESWSSTKHGKIALILSCLGIGILFGVFLLYCLWKKNRSRHENTENGLYITAARDPSEVPNNPAQPFQTDNAFDDQLQSGVVVYENPNHFREHQGTTVGDRGQSWPLKEVTIKRSPNSPEVQAGSRVEFRCVGNGCHQVLYRWFQDGQELPGENNSTLILNPLKMQDFGSYRCEVRSDKRDDERCVESELDVTPAEGESYKTLTEVFQSSIDLRTKVAILLRMKVEGIAGYKHVASHYEMDIDVLEQCENPGEGVITNLAAKYPDLAVYHFCKVLKDKKIRRLDIVDKLKNYLI